MLNIFISYKLYVLFSPFVALMLYDFMQEGMIFEKYGRWLSKEIIKKDGNKYVPKYKYPMGYCLKCFGFWVIVIYTLLPFSKILLFTILIGIAYYILAVCIAARIQ